MVRSSEESPPDTASRPKDLPLRRFLLVLVLPSLAVTASAAQASFRPGIRRDFQRLSDSGANGVVTLAIGDDAYRRLSEQYQSDVALSLDHLPLPGGLEARLELRPVCALEPGARAQIVQPDGEVALLAPRVRCFSGYAEGGGPAFIGISEDELHGY